MQIFIVLSLALNIAVLLPVCYGIVTDAEWARESYGEATPARGILLSIYLSIVLVSTGLLFYREPKYVAALILVQIIYKAITPFAVDTISNPVIISNLLIAAFHSVTLFIILQQGDRLNIAS